MKILFQTNYKSYKSFKVCDGNGPNEPFDLANSQIVSTELGVDQVIKGKNPIDQLVMLFELSKTEIEPNKYVYGKPIAIANRYLGRTTTSAPKSLLVKSWKGSALKETGGIVITVLVISTWQVKLRTIDLPNAGTYNIFQTIMVYGYRAEDENKWDYDFDCVYRDDVFAVPADQVVYETVGDSQIDGQKNNNE
ncbi:hypothetical protein DFA_06796 [Cavenderia fasciculata]|uniref:Monalysin Pore-forming domain-containing protein n=1 Tax=Cavenderia fasciculata TaxID=261658 RepID=F4Q2A9_CACFS|nr:uncharacterized protein DFA_06796 [Cavenderia fasciculata]EGG18129.1 hypothetical protein DFA_06796 [Cavenderia fasciculata]|eukprot:XP_004366170.1 hypothetical protein DFA_06796 [Cavenderia fasciculata]